MKILHTSDWHIGRQLHGVALIDDQRHVLKQIVAIVAARAIDVVVIAGDIYDRAVPSPDAVTLLDQVLHALNGECGVPVILIAGNHDGPERLGFGARQLAQAGVHVCGPLLLTAASRSTRCPMPIPPPCARCSARTCRATSRP